MTDTLKDKWIEAKNNENVWKEQRIAIESAIYEENRARLSDKGTYTTGDGIKIVTGYTEKWDQVCIASLSRNWQANVPFPFELEYKPVAASIKFIKENMPEAYKYISTCLTLTPKKPSFSVKE